ncbi:MAG TPA: hypothetical protein VMV24_00750 [Candidatus Dormibacteraeota bacterium]|nr:hypothetical protein [Candidatus Dormibacteraeota bacterium]
MKKFGSRLSVVLGLILFMSLCVFWTNSFASSTIESISTPYKSVSAIKAGSIVSLDTSGQDKIVVASTANQQYLVGVAVGNQQSLFAVNDSSSTTQVISEGLAQTLVSTMNGPVSIGSQITVSPLSGIGANAISGSRIVGIAETAFSSSSVGAVSENIYDNSNHAHKIYIGYIPVLISVGNNVNNVANGGLLNSIHNFASSVAGHTISTVSLLLVFIVIIVALVSIIILIYSAISGGLISIGRNPLAKSSILAAIGQIFVMVIIIAATSVAIIYFILY